MFLKGDNLRKPIYFIRHGETTANEQNIFSGILDVPLTELGRQQAKEAGRIILEKGLEFDEVHVSHLERSKTTALLALRESNQENIHFNENQVLAERDFGAYTKRNKNLLRKACGYSVYEKTLHTPFHEPAFSEPFRKMYERVHEYYHNVLVPRAESGMSILVVSHKYVIEMFALIIAGLRPEDYFDFRLPNAKPMSEEELKTYIKKESRALKEIGDRVTYHSSWLIFGASISGFIMKNILKIPLNSTAFLFSVGMLLTVSTFFVMLSLNTNLIAGAFKPKRSSLLPWCFKFLIVGSLLIIIRDEVKSNLMLLFLMPPALTVPVLSLLWGGSLYSAIEKTVLLSCLAPIVLGGIVLFSGTGFNPSFLPFMTILVTSMLIPAFAAQQIRRRKPIESAKFTEHWKWLGVLAIIILSFISVYNFTPINAIGLFLQESKQGSIFIKQGILVLTVFALIKTFAFITSRLICEDRSHVTDCYITHSTPNIFLWISLISLQVDAMFIGFWACLFFFSGILFDELYFVSIFIRDYFTTSKVTEQVWHRGISAVPKASKVRSV